MIRDLLLKDNERFILVVNYDDGFGDDDEDQELAVKIGGGFNKLFVNDPYDAGFGDDGDDHDTKKIEGDLTILRSTIMTMMALVMMMTITVTIRFRVNSTNCLAVSDSYSGPF